ncbi:MAG: hypothetical protein AUI53_06360 [Acidobacteria bacterium 13_1_40CM_2_60_7]|nr:MAG: hypothetical protein AUI53_06360 [Acidobacteria bacterium 13_1_40CM_2_60_7]OLE85207.1 MAG: hypothetical protein AUG07_05035 [Acidobacteria bacterium 13_1_20CM_2_60_10]
MNASSPAQPESVRERPPLLERVRDFWRRVSEGRQIGDLWAQFTADARATYGFYSREVDWDAADKKTGLQRALHIARGFFWALLLKLSPARRVLLLIALGMLVLSGLHVKFGSEANLDINFQFLATLLFFFLLVLELADRVAMKRDLEIAREIQTWLVPSSPPEIPGAEMAFAARAQNTVAGDYYDAFYPTASAADGGKLLVVVADVAGKSVPAALLMATLQASLRTIAGEGASLEEMVTRLNRYTCGHSLGGLRFTTAVLAEYDPTTRAIQYVNAGHNPPVLRRNSGDLEFFRTGGLPLGIAASSSHQTARVELHPGDALVLYTDGVVEAFDEGGKEFGEDRWFAAIRGLPQADAPSMLRHLMQRVDEFVGRTRQSDDITCLVLRVRS